MMTWFLSLNLAPVAAVFDSYLYCRLYNIVIYENDFGSILYSLFY